MQNIIIDWLQAVIYNLNYNFKKKIVCKNLLRTIKSEMMRFTTMYLGETDQSNICCLQ